MEITRTHLDGCVLKRSRLEIKLTGAVPLWIVSKAT